MELSEVYESISDNIKGADLQGREFTLVIATVDVKTFDDQSRKLIVGFQNAKKTLVVNKTNADRIAYLYGTNTDGWIGKEIVLYFDPMVAFAGKITGGIRVKPPVKQVPQVSVAAGTNGKHVVTDKGKYKTSELRRNEDADALDDTIPF